MEIISRQRRVYAGRGFRFPWIIDLAECMNEAHPFACARCGSAYVRLCDTGDVAFHLRTPWRSAAVVDRFVTPRASSLEATSTLSSGGILATVSLPSTTLAVPLGVSASRYLTDGDDVKTPLFR